MTPRTIKEVKKDLKADFYQRAYDVVEDALTEVDMEADTVTWNDGWNDWTFYGVEDWMVGDGIAVIMSDEGMESVKDDRMMEARYWNPDTVTLGYWGK